MECVVGLDEGRLVGDLAARLFEEFPERGEVFVARPDHREAHAGRFEDLADLDHLFEGVLFDEVQHLDVVHHDAVPVGHEDAFAHAGFQHAGVFQRAQGLAEGGTAYAEHVRKLPLGREAISAFQFSLDQQLLDLLNDLPRNGALDDFIEHIPLSFWSNRLMMRYGGLVPPGKALFRPAGGAAERDGAFHPIGTNGKSPVFPKRDGQVILMKTC